MFPSCSRQRVSCNGVFAAYRLSAATPVLRSGGGSLTSSPREQCGSKDEAHVRSGEVCEPQAMAGPVLPDHFGFLVELRQMLLVDAIDLNLHLGMPALHQDGEFADQSSRAKPFKQDFLSHNS